jgi:hypothetical protein
VNIETLTPAEKVKLLQALENSLGVAAVAYVEIDYTRDQLHKMHPDQEPPSAELIRRAAQELTESERLAEQMQAEVVAWVCDRWPYQQITSRTIERV